MGGHCTWCGDVEIYTREGPKGGTDYLCKECHRFVPKSTVTA